VAYAAGMRVALCQLPISPEPAINLDRVAEAGGQRRPPGADLAVFPEATQARFGSDLRAAGRTAHWRLWHRAGRAGPWLRVALVVGVFEPAPDGRVYNTAVAYSGSGDLVAAYRKIHLFDSLGERESAMVAPGSEPVVAELAGIRTGFATCYDIRFPELARALVARGAELIVVPTAWRRAVQGGALGHPGAGPRDREHGLGRRRRAGSRPASPPTRAPTGVGRSMLVIPWGLSGPTSAVAAGDRGRTGQRADRRAREN